MSVRIYELDRAFALWVWLCIPHKERREASGFLVKTDRDPPHDGLTCLDCHFGEPTTTKTEGAASNETDV